MKKIAKVISIIKIKNLIILTILVIIIKGFKWRKELLMINCPICKGTLKNTTKTIVYKYKNHTKNIKQKGEYCTSCGESFLSPKDLKSTQKDIVNFKREVDHLLTTQELKRIRKKFHLTQKEASNLFGGGVRAFHKYETAEVTQSKPLDILFRLIDSNKITLEDIKQLSV